jgi:hypothetical protein
MDNTKPISQVRIRAVKATDVPSRLRSLGDDPEAVQRLVNDPGFGVIVEFRFAYLAHSILIRPGPTRTNVGLSGGKSRSKGWPDEQPPIAGSRRPMVGSGASLSVDLEKGRHSERLAPPGHIVVISPPHPAQTTV